MANHCILLHWIKSFSVYTLRFLFHYKIKISKKMKWDHCNICKLERRFSFSFFFSLFLCPHFSVSCTNGLIISPEETNQTAENQYQVTKIEMTQLKYMHKIFHPVENNDYDEEKSKNQVPQNSISTSRETHKWKAQFHYIQNEKDKENWITVEGNGWENLEQTKQRWRNPYKDGNPTPNFKSLRRWQGFYCTDRA